MKSRTKPQNPVFSCIHGFCHQRCAQFRQKNLGLLTRAFLSCPDKVVPFLLRECSRREPAQADAVYRYDHLREKANLENPQIFQICKYKNNFSAEYIRVAAPCVCFVPWTALASYRPRPQQLLPVSAAGSGRRCCRANAAAIQNITPASFSAAVPQWASAGRRAAASAPWCMPA